MANDPRSPLRADHRFMQRLFGSTLGGKVDQTRDGLDLIARVFHKVGGSWERVFRGSPEDITLLKKIMKRAFKRGLLPKAQNWGS